MAHVAALSSPALADGFRLAGIGVVVARPGAELRIALRDLIGRPDLGLLLITADLWSELDERTRSAAEFMARPLVLSVPAGAVAEAGTRRELLGEMLERAIGFRIELEGKAA
jgi:vacuolar-type H+-ATPase subunit F/Vma7